MLRRIVTVLALITIGIMGVFFTPFDASAAPPCGERERVTKLLSEKYKENQASIGVTHNGGLIEVWVNQEDDTWSIIVTTPQGMACLVAAGNGWQSLAAPPSGERL